MSTLRGKRILVTGPAGQIAFPLVEELSQHNEVWGIARFTEDEYEFTETVGICPNGNTMEPLEAADGGGFIGYLAPGEELLTCLE